jgi:hypothetical protein
VALRSPELLKPDRSLRHEFFGVALVIIGPLAGKAFSVRGATVEGSAEPNFPVYHVKPSANSAELHA